MRKYIRALEIPIYLFVIALIMFEKDIQGIGIFLIIVSIVTPCLFFVFPSNT